MDITLDLTEDAEVFFAMTGSHCCVDPKTETIFFDFSDPLKFLPESLQSNTENLGIEIKRHKAYMIIYDYVLHCLVHEPLHCLVSRLKPRVDYCPFFNAHGIVDNYFVNDAITDILGIELHKD